MTPMAEEWVGWTVAVTVSMVGNAVAFWLLIIITELRRYDAEDEKGPPHRISRR